MILVGEEVPVPRVAQGGGRSAEQRRQELRQLLRRVVRGIKVTRRRWGIAYCTTAVSVCVAGDEKARNGQQHQSQYKMAEGAEDGGMQQAGHNQARALDLVNERICVN